MLRKYVLGAFSGSRASVPTRAFTSQIGRTEAIGEQQANRHGNKTRQARRPPASDISATPTSIVRLSNLPPGTTADDIWRMIVPGRNYMAKTNSLQFEYDLHLRPLNSCRAKFFKVSDAQAFATSTNNVPFAGSTLRADFVTRESVPNPTVEKYIGHALGRLVYLYGYPPYVNQHQIRDFYKDYEIVDTVIPGVQPAPQQGVTFLSRRGAFILQFATPSEARRFVRDVYMTEYNPPASQDLSDDIPPPTPASTKKTASTGAQKHYLKAILLK